MTRRREPSPGVRHAAQPVTGDSKPTAPAGAGVNAGASKSALAEGQRPSKTDVVSTRDGGCRASATRRRSATAEQHLPERGQITMLTTTTATRSRPTPLRHGAPAFRVSALRVALDDAQARLDAALAELGALVSHHGLGAEDASALEAEYVERYLRRIAALEERGALACTPEEWRRFTATAARRTAARRSAAARRERARNALAARQRLVVAPGRILDPLLAGLVGVDQDAETLEIRAALAAAQLL